MQACFCGCEQSFGMHTGLATRMQALMRMGAKWARGGRSREEVGQRGCSGAADAAAGTAGRGLPPGGTSPVLAGTSRSSPLLLWPSLRLLSFNLLSIVC